MSDHIAAEGHDFMVTNHWVGNLASDAGGQRLISPPKGWYYLNSFSSSKDYATFIWIRAKADPPKKGSDADV